MRVGRNNGMLTTDNGTLVGVSLGADYCAEHEWGIAGIRRRFGMSDDKSVFGIVRRTVQAFPDCFYWVEKEVSYKPYGKRKAVQVKMAGFLMLRPYDDKPETAFSRLWECRDRSPYPQHFEHNKLWSAWDENSFAAVATDPEIITQLRTIFEAAKRCDLAIWVGGAGVFRNGGLILAMPSKCQPEDLQTMEDADREQFELERDAAATGIEERLRAAKKGYYALSPRRTADGCVEFWLNPTEQDRNNYGRFTVEDLDAWIRGEGPIPKAKKKAA